MGVVGRRSGLGVKHFHSAFAPKAGQATAQIEPACFVIHEVLSRGRRQFQVLKQSCRNADDAGMSLVLGEDMRSAVLAKQSLKVLCRVINRQGANAADADLWSPCANPGREGRSTQAPTQPAVTVDRCARCNG